MFGLSAKERLAQLQQKGSKDAPVGKLSAGLKPTPGKLNSGPGQLKKPEPPKPAADLKKPVAPQPVKPKEDPKVPAVQEPAKPKEEPKAPVAPEPSKPKEELQQPTPAQPVKPTEEPKARAVLEPAKPKEEPKKPAAPEPAKTKDESKTPAAAEPAKPKEEPKKSAAPEPAKPKEEPKKLAAPEPAKPKEEPKKPAASEPAKPKEEPKKPVAPEPAKPKEEPKKPAAPEPAKPKEEPKKPAAPEPVKPKEEPKKPAASEPAKPKEEPKKPAAPEPAKPKEEPKKQAAPEPSKPVGEPAAAKPVEEHKKPSDDFFRGIFYFSGMGTLVGSALAEGVYVPEKTQRNALDSDEIEAARERQKLRRGEEIIATARNQAQGLSTDFRHLQALLDSLPTFTEALEPQPLDRRAVDQVIHGHVYFQQEQHAAPTHSRPAHHHLPSSAAAAEIASHVPQHQATHGVTEARRAAPVGGVPVMPDLFDQRHRPPATVDQHKEAASFAAAIDEFDRATSASHQQPVFAAPSPTHRPPSEPSRQHARERPTEHGEGHGGPATRPFGVHTGHAGPTTPTQPWQERYGQTEVTKFAAPRPFSATGGEIDSKGIKPWQMSHLRTLEVKGYHIVSDTEPDAIKSYAPYLVSDRSQGADRQLSSSLHHQHPQQHRVVGSSPHPVGAFEGQQVSASSYRPSEATNAPFAQSLEASVGYSDL